MFIAAINSTSSRSHSIEKRVFWKHQTTENKQENYNKYLVLPLRRLQGEMIFDKFLVAQVSEADFCLPAVCLLAAWNVFIREKKSVPVSHEKREIPV
jgi:hypothetical protein